MRRNIDPVKSIRRSVSAGLLTLLVLSLAAYGSEPETGPAAAKSADPAFKEGNLDRVRRFLAGTSAPGRALDDS
jgi:hypothetical protein